MFHNPAYNYCIPADRFHSKEKEVKKKNERYDCYSSNLYTEPCMGIAINTLAACIWGNLYVRGVSGK